MKMHSKLVASILLAFAIICASCISCISLAEEGNRYEQAVPFGVAHNEDGSNISIYQKPGSKKASGSISDYTLCAVLSSEKLSGTTWYHVSYFDNNQNEQAGYVRDGEFYQLTVSGLIAIASDPNTAAYLQMFAGVAGSAAFTSDITAVSRSMPAEPDPTIAPTAEPAAAKQPTYILNKNTKKFHYPSCSSADDIKPKNRLEFFGTREEAIQKGYKPCKRCNP